MRADLSPRPAHDKAALLAHYRAQAELAGDATHLAALISRHPSYSADELAKLITAVAAHAAHLVKCGVPGMDRVSELLDDAADIAEGAYVSEPAR